MHFFCCCLGSFFVLVVCSARLASWVGWLGVQFGLVFYQQWCFCICLLSLLGPILHIHQAQTI